MNKKCAKCGKTVYPTEELKALDKVWHKLCFRCEVCGMLLNMKNYKGYNKLPYCQAHYPTSKPTAVADTPEARRIAQNTKVQSNIQYHKDFEEQKGQKTSVADDPETQRIKANTQIQSNVNYWGIKEQRDNMESLRPNEMVDDVRGRSRNPGKISDYDPPAPQINHGGHVGGHDNDYNSPYSHRNAATVVYDSSRGGQGQRTPQQSYQPPPQQNYQPPPQQNYQPPPPQNNYNPPAPQPAYSPPAPAPQPARVAQPPPPKQVRFVAMYDYTAADDDEVTFFENDIIVNAEKVDEGWMTGTVERTGQHGMLPSNYVEQC